MDRKDVIVEQEYAASPAHVWSAISDVTEMRDWYFPLDAFEPRVGFAFSFVSGNSEDKPYLHLCKVVEVIPQQKLSYTWQYDGLPGCTTVSFELSEQGGGTLLRLTHSGIETLAEGGADFKKENFIGGWNHFLKTALADYLKGQTSSA